MTDKPSAIERAPCPTCGGDRNCFARGNHSNLQQHGPVSDCTTGSVMQCCGCSTIFYREEYWFSEETDYEFDPDTGDHHLVQVVHKRYWPPVNSRERPEWLADVVTIDKRLKLLLDELYLALDTGLLILSGIGVRTCLDAVTELLGIEPGWSFNQKLDALRDNGHITQSERETFSTLVDAGSAAAHRGWSPTPKDLQTMIEILEQFIHRSFFLGEATKELKQQIPTRNKPLNTA